jgi:DNA-binding NtrC family response regulator
MGETHRILYVEDDQHWVKLLQWHIDRVNALDFNQKFKRRIELTHAETGEQFIDLLHSQVPFDLALIDLQLENSQMQGGDIINLLKNDLDAPPRVVLTAQPQWVPEQTALEMGVFEYYLKYVLIADDASQAAGEVHQQNIQSFLETFFDLPSRYDFVSEEGLARFGLRRREAELLQQTIVSDDLNMWRVRANAASAARSNLPVLITGESGTGKELVAEMIHRLSGRGRKNYEWVAVNCAEFTSDILVSELFGHVKGAFTDARADKRGLLEEANESTLFLDEVGHADPRLQASLLRALSTGRARRLGSTEEYTVDVRLIAATDQPIFDSGQLQQSFLNRLAGIHIHIPPLRERLGDIHKELLVGAFGNHVALSENKKVHFTQAAIMALKQHSWPGNVRELKHVVEAATREAIYISGEATEVKVDAPQVRWLLQQSMARLAHPATKADDVFGLFTARGQTLQSVKRQFAAGYIHHVHQKIAGGERTNAAYAATAQFLDCSPSIVKAKLSEHERERRQQVEDKK